MTDKAPNSEDQKDPNSTPQDPPSTPAPKQDAGDGKKDGSKYTTEDYEQMLAKARGEAAEYRKKASEIQKKNEAYEEEKSKAETERLKEEGKYKEAAEKAQRDLDEYKKTAESRQIAAEVKAAAIAAGIVDPKASRLVEVSGIKFDDSGELVGVAEAIEALKKESPGLFKIPADKSKEVKPTGSDKGDPPPATKGSAPVALATKEDGSYVLSDAEYEKAKKEMLKRI